MEERKTVQMEIVAEAHLQFEPGVVVGAGGGRALEGKAKVMLAAAAPAPGDDNDQEALGRKL